MNARPIRPATWLLVLLALSVAIPSPTRAEDDAAQPAGGKEKMEKGAGEDGTDTPGMKDKGGDGGAKSGKSGKAPTARIYFFKSYKKAKLAGAEVTNVVVEDVFSGKKETLVVHDAAVAAVVEGMEEGTAISVEAEKKGGKWTASSIAKADIKPGEEHPNAYVYVSSDEGKDRGGNKTVTVTLRKFGREVKVGVPMWKNTNYEKPTWEPDSKIDGQLQQLEPGEVVAALIKPGRPPMLAAIYPYEPPERGKFVQVKEAQHNGATAAAFEMVAADGTTITVLLPGTAKQVGERKVLMPDPKMLRAVQNIKADTEIEVLFREEGGANLLIDLKFLKAADAKGGKGGKDKKPDAGKGKAGDGDVEDGNPAKS